MTTELQTIDTDALVTATGGASGGALGHGQYGHHPFLALDNTLQTTLAQQNQQSQNTQLMTVAMLGLALRDR